MGLKHLQKVVLAVVVLVAIRSIFANTLYDVDFSNLDWDDPVFKNLTSTMRAINVSSGAFLEGAYIAANGTPIAPPNSVNLTLLAHFYNEPKTEKSYWFNSFPKNLFLYALTIPVQYLWNIYLERWLPARKTPKVPAASAWVEDRDEKSDLAGEDNHEWEQKVVDRWIAQGKVTRSSISIWRTLLKWMLDFSIGNVLFEVVFHFIEIIIFKRTISKFRKNLLSPVFSCLSYAFPSLGPLVTLVGFIAVPARNRLVFLHVGLFIQTLFSYFFFSTIIPGFFKTAFAQAMMQHYTEEMWQGATISAMGPSARIPTRVLDEL